MVRKLMLVTSLIVFSSTCVEAMDEEFQSPKRENRERSTPQAPKKRRVRRPHVNEDARAVRALDLNNPLFHDFIDSDDETEN